MKRNIRYVTVALIIAFLVMLVGGGGFMAGVVKSSKSCPRTLLPKGEGYDVVYHKGGRTALCRYSFSSALNKAYYRIVYLDEFIFIFVRATPGMGSWQEITYSENEITKEREFLVPFDINDIHSVVVVNGCSVFSLR